GLSRVGGGADPQRQVGGELADGGAPHDFHQGVGRPQLPLDPYDDFGDQQRVEICGQRKVGVELVRGEAEDGGQASAPFRLQYLDEVLSGLPVQLVKGGVRRRASRGAGLVFRADFRVAWLAVRTFAKDRSRVTVPVNAECADLGVVTGN